MYAIGCDVTTTTTCANRIQGKIDRRWIYRPTTREQMNFFIIHTLDRRNSGWSIPRTIRWSSSSSGEEMDRKRRNVVVQTSRTTTIVGKKWNLSTLYWFPTRSSEYPAGPGCPSSINGQISSVSKYHHVRLSIHQIGVGSRGNLLYLPSWVGVYLLVTCYGHVGRLVNDVEFGGVPRDLAPIGTCGFALQPIQDDGAIFLITNVRLVRIQVHAVHGERHDGWEHHRRVPDKDKNNICISGCCRNQLR